MLGFTRKLFTNGKMHTQTQKKEKLKILLNRTIIL